MVFLVRIFTECVFIKPKAAVLLHLYEISSHLCNTKNSVVFFVKMRINIRKCSLTHFYNIVPLLLYVKYFDFMYFSLELWGDFQRVTFFSLQTHKPIENIDTSRISNHNRCKYLNNEKCFTRFFSVLLS